LFIRKSFIIDCFSARIRDSDWNKRVVLGFTQSEDEGNYASGEKNNAYRLGQLVATFSLDAEFSVANVEPVILAMRNWNDKREHSKHQQQNSNEGKRFHRETPLLLMFVNTKGKCGYRSDDASDPIINGE
jgi:hypothetical protein